MAKRIIAAQSNKREYRKFIAVFVFIFLASTLMSTLISFRWLDWMRWFVGTFLLIFGGFKLISFESFLDVFPRYDILAARYNWYAFAYPVVQVLLGVFFILDIAPVFRQLLALAMVGTGLVGVASGLLHKGPSSKHTWLGNFLRLPMTTAILFENAILTVALFIIVVAGFFS